jgi:hypothetical protein
VRLQHGFTLLHIATAKGYLSFVEFLVNERKHDLEARTPRVSHPPCDTLLGLASGVRTDSW